ncbi:uncharacterized protein JCM10292_002540 [Rhodotorula paludigena]|uniref:uncharacterized protein n=1 Tax=Rhodotorula paludigena TaxID=86838 RepID=UPI00317FAE12
MNSRRPSVRKKPTHAGEPPAESAAPDRKLETFYHVAIGCFVAHLELKLGYEVHKHGTVTGAAGVELLLRPHIFEQTEPDDRVPRFARPEEWPVLGLSVSGSRRDPLTVDDIYEDLHDDVLSVPTEDGGLTIAQVSVSIQKEASLSPQFIVDTAIGLDRLQGDSAAQDAFVAWYEKRYSSPHSLSKRELSALGKSYQAVFDLFKKWLEVRFRDLSPL